MRNQRPASHLCHPAFIAALALLLLNDHYLKAAHPSWVTGKLSDLAGLVVAPIAIVSACEVIGSFVGHRRFNRTTATVASSLAVGTLFTLVQTVPVATSAYAKAAGTTARLAMTAIGQSAGSGPAAVTADLTDLLTLPALVIPVLVVVRPGLAWRPLTPSGTDPALQL